MQSARPRSGEVRSQVQERRPGAVPGDAPGRAARLGLSTAAPDVLLQHPRLGGQEPGGAEVAHTRKQGKKTCKSGFGVDGEVRAERGEPQSQLQEWGTKL